VLTSRLVPDQPVSGVVTQSNIAEGVADLTFCPFLVFRDAAWQPANASANGQLQLIVPLAIQS
jgi:hypothetical protein